MQMGDMRGTAGREKRSCLMLPRVAVVNGGRSRRTYETVAVEGTFVTVV